MTKCVQRASESPPEGGGAGAPPGGRCPPVGRKGGSPAGNKVSARRADGAIYFLPFDFVKREKVTKRENRPGGISIFPPGPPFKNDQLGGLYSRAFPSVTGPLLEKTPGELPGGLLDESALCLTGTVFVGLRSASEGGSQEPSPVGHGEGRRRASPRVTPVSRWGLAAAVTSGFAP